MIGIEPGGVYELRNGAQVLIDGMVTIPYAINGHALAWYGWGGTVLATGNRCTWELDGSYSPAHKNELDILLTAPSK